MNGFIVAALVVAAGTLPASAAAAEIRSVQAPERVRAGDRVQIVVDLEPGFDVCSIRIGGEPHGAVATDADRLTWRFRISRRTRPGTYTLPLSCTGHPVHRLRLTVTRRKGAKPGTVRRIVTTGTFTISTHEPPPPRAPGAASSFRAVYALPADRTERPGHVAAIAATIESVNAWFATQTIGNVQPRWMRDASGAPEVTVVRLPERASFYAAPHGLGQLRLDLLEAAPRAARTQRDVVFTPIEHPDACAVFELDTSWITENACAIHPVAPATWPRDATFVTAHELLHNFGAHHVGNDPRDVLYAGARERAWDALMLDPGHDDYYGTGRRGDIANSPYWTQTADPRT